MSVEKVLKDANKKYNTSIMTKGSQHIVRQRIPFGSLSFDVETGGGVPTGAITTISGAYSDGKTSVVLKIVANYQRKFPAKDVVWIDAEGSWDRNWSSTLGVDVDRVFLVHPEYSQQAFDIAEQCITANVGLLVVDSIAALVPKEEAEATMEDWQVGLAARINNKFIRRTHSSLNDKRENDVPPTVVLINQLREKVGPYGGQTEPGGMGIGFAASLRIKIRKGDYYPPSKANYDENAPRPKAQQVKFFIEKNKTAPPRKNGHVWFYFDFMDKHRPKGCYDVLEEIVRYVKKYDVIPVDGSWFRMPDLKTGELVGGKGLNGATKFVDYLRENPCAQKWIEDKTMEVVQANYANEIESVETRSPDDNSSEGEKSSEKGQRQAAAGERSDTVGKGGHKERKISDPAQTSDESDEESFGDFLELG